MNMNQRGVTADTATTASDSNLISHVWMQKKQQRCTDIDFSSLIYTDEKHPVEFPL